MDFAYNLVRNYSCSNMKEKSRLRFNPISNFLFFDSLGLGIYKLFRIKRAVFH